MAWPSILLCTDQPNSAQGVRQTLESAGFSLVETTLEDPDPLQRLPIGMVVIEAEHRDASALCRRLRQRGLDPFVPILLTSSAQESEIRRTGLDAGADSALALPVHPGELVAHILALFRIKTRHDQLSSKAAEVTRVNQRLQQATEQIDLELDWARRIQESFLPKSLPTLPQLEFAVKYKPCGRVGGDFYDAFRLDEHHLAFYVADAMGHGVPASLLTIFMKKGIVAKEITGKSYRLVPPHEILAKLNRDLIEQALAEQPFVTMAYFLLDLRDGKTQFARAGHPYPLHIPREGPIASWQIEGSLLGVFDVAFRSQTFDLKPGDKLLTFTDGMDSAAFEKHAVGTTSLFAAAREFRHLPIRELVDRLAEVLFNQTDLQDDLTILGVERK